MPVIATAGHVDHGKSTLVRALTGMEPDRWAEERRRGLTIDLGFAWTELPTAGNVAFVDVPGHERFVPNMLAGVGPVPAALLVVAADEGWMPQSAEHLAALDALGVRHAVLAVTRADLADPGAATAQARAQLAATSLAQAEAVAVSAPTGAGLGQLRAALDRLVARLPAPDRSAPVRLWVDRVFTVQGAGTVVTGTLRGGRLRTGDELELAAHRSAGAAATAGRRRVVVRGLQALGQRCDQVAAVARVAVNLRGMARTQLRRGDTLLTPDRFHHTDLIDVRITGDPVSSLPPAATLHIGSAAVTARIRPLGPDTARLRLPGPLPLHAGDRALLRDPGKHHIAGAVTVLDVAPPELARRGAAAQRAAVLAELSGRPDEAAEVRRRRLIRRRDLARMGVPVTGTPVAGDWLAAPDWWRAQRSALRAQVEAYLREHPLAAGMPVAALQHGLALPDRALVTALVTPPLVSAGGLVTLAGRVDGNGGGAPADGRGPADGEGPCGLPALPEPVRHRVDRLRAELAGHPFRAPTAGRLAELSLGARELAAAARAGLLLRLAPAVVLAPEAVPAAVPVLAALPQPFTVSQARQALGSSRRVVVPLLELLDLRGLTRRLADDRREVVNAAAS